MSRFVRELAFRFAKPDLLRFIEDHEAELLTIFQEEMQNLDDRLPEEEALIDVHLAALGEKILQAVLLSLKRFLRGGE